MPKTELKPTTKQEREWWKDYLILQSGYVNCFSARDALRLIADVKRLEAVLEAVGKFARSTDSEESREAELELLRVYRALDKEESNDH